MPVFLSIGGGILIGCGAVIAAYSVGELITKKDVDGFFFAIFGVVIAAIGFGMIQAATDMAQPKPPHVVSTKVTPTNGNGVSCSVKLSNGKTLPEPVAVCQTVRIGARYINGSFVSQ